MTALGSCAGKLLIVVLVTLATLALPLEASAPIHVHHGEIPGLYNGECPLATLAAFHGLAPLPSAPAPASIGLAVGTALLVATATFVIPLLGHTDPRAPPFRLI